MDFFSILIIIVLCIYFLPKILGPLMRRFVQWQMQRQMQRMMDQAFGTGTAGSRQQQRRRSPWGSRAGSRQQQQKPRRRTKIFSKNDGEYVEFEEIRTFQQDHEQNGATRTKYTEESQVTDVEWEDI